MGGILGACVCCSNPPNRDAAQTEANAKAPNHTGEPEEEQNQRPDPDPTVEGKPGETNLAHTNHDEQDAEARELRQLRNTKKTQDFTFAGRCCWAKVVDVYDGDTVRVKFLYGGQEVQWCARLDGIDCPEMKPPKTSPNRDAEVQAAKESKAALHRTIGNQVVYLRCGKFDMYKRILTTILLEKGDKESISQWMIAAGYAVPYDGKTKSVFKPRTPTDAEKSARARMKKRLAQMQRDV